MQNLATYSLIHNATSVTEAESSLSECAACVDRWLSGKGRVIDGRLVLERGGREAALTSATYESSVGVSREWELTEPLDGNLDAEFRTNLQLAQRDDTVFLYLTLKAGYRDTTIAPELQLAVKPPRVLFDLAKVPGMTWHFGSMPVGLKPLTFDANHTEKVIEWLAHPNRSMPVVVLSEYEGEVLHPDARWQEKVVERLFGMALVIRFRAELSWALTESVGKVWSCYHGAVRIYWPKLDFNGDPFRHDLMIAEDIMERFDTNDRRIAADRMLEQLFDRFRRISAFSVRCPAVFPELRRATSQEGITGLRKQVATKRDATKATAGFAADNKQLKEELATSKQLEKLLMDEVRRLEQELAEAADDLTRIQNEWDNHRLLQGVVDKGASPPVVQHQAQLTTVTEAIDRAREEYRNDLVFGRDVEDQVSRLKVDAGPPSKVFTHLMKLAEASRSLQQAVEVGGSATLGKPLCDWLCEKGVAASGEYAQTMNSKKEQKARMWDFGNGSEHVFENHTKPSDATSPNQCVRIYFAWCEDRRKIVIGSVGQKPGL